MIKTAATQQDEIVYEDIMGTEQTITAKEVIAICQDEIERMAKLTANTIKELNGGTSPSAVFIVGGGGKIKGFNELIAAELGLDPKRVALRGEEIMRDIDFPEDALKDSTIITPIGICLTYYEQYNNFIYITFNGSKIKLYDNNKLTVTDAAIQADFTRDGLFPRRGEELRYTVNGKNRVTKGEYGESAHIYVNGEEVSLSYNIKANDVIVLEESTLGNPPQEKIADLIDYNGKIVVSVNGDDMQLPKPVKVNGTAVTEEYLIQNGDEIEVFTTYTYDSFFAFMDLSPEDMLLFVNGEKADDTVEIHASDKIEIKNRKEHELKEIYEESQREAVRDAVKDHVSKAEKKREQGILNTEKKSEELPAQETVSEAPDNEKENTDSNVDKNVTTSADKETESEKKQETAPDSNSEAAEKAPTESASEPVAEEEPKQEKAVETAAQPETKKKEEPKEEVKEEIGKKIIVIVNQNPIVMRGKQSYMFVDIFDYIDFDTSRVRGGGIATLVNGKDAQYTQEIYNGDKIEVYWK